MSQTTGILIGLLLGIVIGCVIGWLAGLRRSAALPTDNRLEGELRQQLAQRESEVVQQRETVTQLNTARATAEAQKAAAEHLLAEQREIHNQALETARQSQEKAILDLREAFKALSADALKQTHPEFLTLANETLGKFQESAKGDLAARQQAIVTVVKPLEEQLRIYQQRLQQSEATQSSALGEVKKHLETL